MRELFLDFKNLNDQSALLWNDRGKIRFFGGGRGASPLMPFKMATSTDNGATWVLSLPQIDKSAKDITPQPITSAFRNAADELYLAMDGKGATSFLWRSTDEGLHWHDMGGRTGGRHSAIVPLNDKGSLLSIGGKNAEVGGLVPPKNPAQLGGGVGKGGGPPVPPVGGGPRPVPDWALNGKFIFLH